MIRALYTIVLSLLLLLLGLPLLPFILLFPKLRSGLLQRFGAAPRDLKRLALVGQGSLWMHAASLGEVNAIAPFLELLRAKLDCVPLLITCTTQAGVAQAKKFFPEATAVLLLPIDLPVFLAPLFKRFKPRFAVIAETELWPNLLHGLHARGCQLMLANGRMTERSLRRYLWFKPLFSPSLLCFDSLAVQSEEDAARFRRLGAKAARIVVTGNTKFDVAEAAKQAKKKAEGLGLELGLAQGSPLIVAGSTRPGEEAALLWAFGLMKKEMSGLKLLLAPRHLERVDEVFKLAESQGFKATRRSQAGPKSDVIILDSLGELAGAYSLGSLAWIGGSWEPWGGQNPIEASAQGLPVIFGPHMEHFRDPARILLEAKAACQVEASQLAEISLRLLKNPAERQAMGTAGLGAVKLASGASQRTADLAWKLAVLARLRRDEHDWRNQSAFASLKMSEFGSSLETEN